MTTFISDTWLKRLNIYIYRYKNILYIRHWLWSTQKAIVFMTSTATTPTGGNGQKGKQEEEQHTL